MSEIGHNVVGAAGDQIKSIVERIERLELRKLDPEERKEQETIVATYARALGMWLMSGVE